jgi:hypothetical protein
MAFDENGVFRVGKTTLDTPLQITIPAYDYELPEINSSSPIIMPMYVPLKYIINWLERGIYIDFTKKESDAEKVLYFILEYNQFAVNYNKKIKGRNGEPLKIAYNAQNMLCKMFNYSELLIKKKEAGEIPFKFNRYKGINHSEENKERMKQRISKAKSIENVVNNAVHAYDIFAPDIPIEIPEYENFKDIGFTE